jgi:hypothetical protein
MMPPIDESLQPRVVKFLETIRRKGKPKTLHLVELRVGHPEETLLQIDPEALRGDPNNVAEEIATVLQRRADDRRTSVRSELRCTGEDPVYLTCRPAPPTTLAINHRTNDGDDTEVPVPDGTSGIGEDEFLPRGAGSLRHQGALFAMEALTQNRQMFRLTMGAALRREERDTRRIQQLEGQVLRYQEVIEQAILVRENLLDRQAERQFEIERVKQRDKWMQDGFAKIISIVALHAPAILPKFGVAIDPRAKEILFDVVGQVAAAKPFLNAMRLASDVAERGGSNGYSNGHAPPPAAPPPTTAGAIAASTVSGGGESVGAGALAAYSAIVVEFINLTRDKLSMVKPLLETRAGELLDKVVELTDAHGKMFQTIGQAAMAGQATTEAKPGDPEDDRKLLRFVDLCGGFFGSMGSEDFDKIRMLVPQKSREALDEIRRDYHITLQSN